MHTYSNHSMKNQLMNQINNEETEIIWTIMVGPNRNFSAEDSRHNWLTKHFFLSALDVVDMFGSSFSLIFQNCKSTWFGFHGKTMILVKGIVLLVCFHFLQTEITKDCESLKKSSNVTKLPWCGTTVLVIFTFLCCTSFIRSCTFCSNSRFFCWSSATCTKVHYVTITLKCHLTIWKQCGCACFTHS